MEWDDDRVRDAAESQCYGQRVINAERTLGCFGRIREIERIIGHRIPEPFSSVLMEDCRMSRTEFAAELIRVSKAVYDC